MKKTLLFIFILLLIINIPSESFGQLKTRKQLIESRNVLRKEIGEKALKQAHKETQRLKKENWKIFPGDKEFDKMIKDSWMQQYEMKLNNDMSKTHAYVWSTSSYTSKTRKDAKKEAVDLARIELTRLVKTYIETVANSNITYAQLSGVVDDKTEQRIIQLAKSKSWDILANITPLTALYRKNIPKKELKKNNRIQIPLGFVEVQVMLFYDLYQADFQTRDVIKQELKDKLKDNEEELKKLMDL